VSGGPAPATVYLIDASPYVFRAYFSLPDSIAAPDGRPVNAVYGFASFLLKLIDEESPTHLGIAFDGSLTTSFRNDLLPGYKASRPLPPPELEAQLDACREVAAALGAATFIDDRYEADDLIGTLCRRLVAAGHRAVVVTSDKDLAQLVGERVTLYDYGKGERLGPAEVEARFGVRPEQIPDLLGLAGDPVDDIPGVAGVGKKTAAALLGAMGDLPAVYERLDEVPGLPIRGAASLAARLGEARDIALLSRRLATVADDAPADAGLDDLAYAGADRAAVEPLFERLGFGRIRDRISRWAEPGARPPVSP
jgi:5'-3' exonuclease